MIAGVAAGMGARFGVDVAIMRIIWGILLLTGPGLPLYLLCLIVIPKEPDDVLSESGPAPSGTFGSMFKIFLLLVAGAIVASHVDRDIAVIAFVIGLAFGLYYLWRNRAQDDEPRQTTSRLYRSTTNKRVLGVFGGLGETLGVDPTLLRIIGGFVLVAGFPIIVPLYLLYAIVVPTRRVIIL